MYLAPLPARDGRFVNAEFLSQLLLCESEGGAQSLDFSDQVAPPRMI